MGLIEPSRPNGAGLRTIADYLPSPIFYCDSDLVYRYVNPAGAELHGRPVSQIVDRPIGDVMVSDQLDLLRERHEAVLAGETLEFEESRKFSNGEDRRVKTDYVPDLDESGRVVGFFVMLTDLTERYNAEVKARETNRQLQAISDAVPAQICFLGRDRHYIWVNRTTVEWFATDVESLVGSSTEAIYGAEFVAETQGYVDRVLAGERVDYEARYMFPDGKERSVDVSYIPNVRGNGVIDGYYLLAHDVTDYRETADALEKLATTDSLTEVSNRRHFLENCEKEVLRARRYGHPLSIVMCDIDHFKQVNDTHGHDGGDVVLKKFTALASAELREDIDTIGRLGGEEFALLLPETAAGSAQLVAERLRESCSNFAMRLPDGMVNVTCSFGVAELTNDDDDFTKVLKRADIALYTAKNEGRNRVCIYRDDEPVEAVSSRSATG